MALTACSSGSSGGGCLVPARAARGAARVHRGVPGGGGQRPARAVRHHSARGLRGARGVRLFFTGAAAGLLLVDDALLGALLGSIVVAAAIAGLGARDHERDSAIGVTLAFGLGPGVYLLGRMHNFASQATRLLFGQIFGVSTTEIWVLVGIAIGVLVVTLAIYRPLLFASVDPELAQGRGVPVRLVGLVFLAVLALTVTEAAQIVGTTLVLCLVITPAAAHRLSASPVVVTMASVVALVAADGGIFVSLAVDVTPSVPITAISFGLYLLARTVGGPLRSRRRAPAVVI